MKLLLDENLPKRLKNDFPEYDIFTVRDMAWNGKKNGELLQLMIAEGFNAFITFDKNLQFQQNLNNYTIPVIVLNAPDNTYECLSALAPQINKIIKEGLKIGANEVRG